MFSRLVPHPWPLFAWIPTACTFAWELVLASEVWFAHLRCRLDITGNENSPSTIGLQPMTDGVMYNTPILAAFGEANPEACVLHCLPEIPNGDWAPAVYNNNMLDQASLLATFCCQSHCSPTPLLIVTFPKKSPPNNLLLNICLWVYIWGNDGEVLIENFQPDLFSYFPK